MLFEELFEAFPDSALRQLGARLFKKARQDEEALATVNVADESLATSTLEALRPEASRKLCASIAAFVSSNLWKAVRLTCRLEPRLLLHEEEVELHPLGW